MADPLLSRRSELELIEDVATCLAVNLGYPSTPEVPLKVRLAAERALVCAGVLETKNVERVTS